MFFSKNFPAFLLVALHSITITMPTAAELKAKFEAEKAERQRREDERAREAEMLREIAEAEEAERKVAEKAEQERLEREKKLLEEARVALAAKELADKKAVKEREAALQTKTTGTSRASSPVKTRVVVSGGDGDCWPCRTKGKTCVFPT